MNMNSNDDRYPYTYACDQVRKSLGESVSRAEASQILDRLSRHLSMDYAECCEYVADLYLSVEKERERFEMREKEVNMIIEKMIKRSKEWEARNNVCDW